MRTYLLPENSSFYKANLHGHSTVSDGKLSPEEIKAAYMEKGYSIIAYTDHDVMIPHPELADEKFLPLTGYEIEINDQTAEGKAIKRTCHLCFIAPTETDTKQVCWSHEKYLFGNSKNYVNAVNADESLPDFIREYSREGINKIINTGKEAGFFISYNHPTWSRESYPEYIGYEGFDALEIINYSCQVGGYEDYNPRVYDDMLKSGKRVFVTGSDDNHNSKPLNSPACDSFGGFTVIKAEKLEYNSVFAALKAGNFYASEAPLINALWYEDGIVHVECSDAASISYICNTRHNRIKHAEAGAAVSSADFEVGPDDKFFRITVTDKNGKHACSHAYFLDEIK